MTKLTAALKKMLNGLAYADASEYLSMREKSEFLKRVPDQVILDPSAEAPVESAEPGSPTRRVALYMGSHLPKEVMEYVIQTCARLKHDLTVLTFETESTARSLLNPYIESLSQAGINMRLQILTGDHVVQRLGRYLRSHPEVAFLACKDNGYLGRSYMNGTQRKNAIPVPVVVVATEKKGTGQQPATTHNTGNQSGVA